MAVQQNSNEWSRHLPFQGFSLQRRLPIIFCLLMLIVLIIFSITSYFTVRKALSEVGQERLRSLTSQVSSMFGQNSLTLLTNTRIAANQDAIKDFLNNPDTAHRRRAHEALSSIQQDSLSVALEIWDLNEKPIWKSGRKSMTGKVPLSQQWVSNIDSSRIGDLFQLEDSMYYPIVVAINKNGEKLGHLVRWRILRASSGTLKQVSALLGSNAAIYVGNASGNLWTNLLNPIPNPLPTDRVQNGDIFRYKRNDGPVMANMRNVPTTPWILLVEFSSATVQQAARQYLRSLILIGSILIVIASLIGWFISRNMTMPLRQLTNAATAIASGNYSVSVDVNRRDEIGKLARAFNAMTSQVRKGHADLEKKISESATLNEQLRELTAHLQNIREEERIHIAREMHDQLGQLLTSFKMDVFMLKKKLGIQQDPAIHEKLTDLEKTTDEAVTFVRKLSAELRPGLLDDLGLIPALEWHSKEFEKRFGIEVVFQSHVKDTILKPEVATGIFRIYQESLTNVARHSGARNVTADLDIKDGYLSLSITDNGKGFANANSGQRKTLGLLGMRERAFMIGGQLDIDSEPGRGTTVSIVVPIQGVQ